MAYLVRCLSPIRASLAVAAPASPFLILPRHPLHGHSYCLKAWIKDFKPVLLKRVARLQWKLSSHRTNASPGSMARMGSILGASVVFGSIKFWPQAAYAMDGVDILVDNPVNVLSTPELDEDPRAVWAIAKKVWLPIILLATVLLNWEHPIILAAKVILILLGTKPSPFSVYVFVEQLRRRAILQNPLLYKFKSLHAKKVEVEDYVVLWLGRIEMRDEKFTVIGVLGSWWILPSASFRDALSAWRSRNL